MTLVLDEDDETHRHRTTPDLAEGDGSATVAINMDQYDDDEADRRARALELAGAALHRRLLAAASLARRWRPS